MSLPVHRHVISTVYTCMQNQHYVTILLAVPFELQWLNHLRRGENTGITLSCKHAWNLPIALVAC